MGGGSVTDSRRPRWLDPEILDQVIRIDLGLEGDWSKTVSCVWDRDSGYLGLPQDLPRTAELRPCLELYMEDGWIGLHCFALRDGVHEVDVERLHSVVEYVDRAWRHAAGTKP